MIKKLIILSFIAAVIITSSVMLAKKTNDKKFYKIAVLSYSKAAEPALLGFKSGLAEYGLFFKTDYDILYSGVIPDKDLLKKEAEKLASLNPDFFYTLTTPATLIAKEAALKKNIPVIFGPVGSAQATGIVDSMVNKSENVTGVTYGPQEQRRFELLTEILPSIKKVLIPFNPTDKSPLFGLELIKPVAEKHGVELVMLPIVDTNEVETALYDFKGEFDAVFATTDAMILSMTPSIAEFAKQKKVPFTTPQMEGVEIGGALFSYGLKIEDVGKQVSRLAYMIINGAQAKDIPVELAEFIFSINMETADTLGIKIPDYLSNGAVVVGHSHVQ